MLKYCCKIQWKRVHKAAKNNNDDDEKTRETRTRRETLTFDNYKVVKMTSKANPLRLSSVFTLSPHAEPAELVKPLYFS